MRHRPLSSPCVRFPARSAPGALAVVLAGILLALPTGCTSRDGGGPTGAGDATKASVPPLLAPPAADIVAYVAIPSLDALLRDVSDLMRNVAGPDAPNRTPKDLKANLGAAIGDPELSAVDGSRPILVAVFKPEPGSHVPPFVGFIPARDGAKLGEQVTGLGLLSRLDGSLLAVTQTPRALELAAKARTLYDSVVAAKLGEQGEKATGRLFLDVDSLLAAYGPLLRQSLDQMTQLMSTISSSTSGMDIARILKLEVLVLQAALAQLDALQLDLDLKGGWMGLETAISARSGSELATFLEGSSRLAAPRRSILDGQADMTASMAVDPAGMAALYEKLAGAVGADPELAGLAGPEVKDLLSSMKESMKGPMVMQMSLGDQGYSLDYEIDASSPAKLLAAYEKAYALMKPEGPLGALYQSMGMKVAITFEKDARKRGEVPVHIARVNTDVTGLAPGDAAQLAAMQPFLKQTAEMAGVAEKVVGSSVAADLDRRIDAVLARKEGTELKLKSREVFGGGRQLYVDADMRSWMRFGLAGVPNETLKKAMTTALADPAPMDPMLVAFTCDGPRGLLQYRLPLELIVRMRKAAAAAATESRSDPQLPR